MFSGTEDQERALEEILRWIERGTSSFLTLGGYAGTGKTTLIARLRTLLTDKNKGLRVAFCAYTGKASQVLNAKLREQQALGPEDSVTTIHGLIYEAITDDEGQLLEWRRRRKINASLIILDEASMVGHALWSDLLSYGVPILAVGDHGQLPPVNDTFSLMADPELRLERIHRQAEDSAIIQISKLIRERGELPFGKFGPGVSRVHSHEIDFEELLGSWNSETLYLAGRNTTRVNLNRRIRAYMGIESEIPVRGDRVICLRNNWQKHIFNGQLGELADVVEAPEKEGRRHWFRAEVNFEDGGLYRGLVSRHQFDQPRTLTEVPGLAKGEIGDLFDYGYALTVHKAQGSQARRAVVFEERIMREEDLWRRWLYTAVTRAESELLIVAS